MHERKFVICRSTIRSNDFDYLEEFSSDGQLDFTDNKLHACVFEGHQIATALKWCEIHSCGMFYFAMDAWLPQELEQ